MTTATQLSMALEQREQLERVSSRVGALVERFVRDRALYCPLFTADDLRDYVLAHEPATAPASPDRVLRLLRQRGRIDYRVVNRRASLYQARAVDE